jgi:TP901 family phage tail tape measure protein
MARDKITVDLMLATKQAEREIAKINRKLGDMGKTMGKAFGGTGAGGDKVRALGSGLSKATVKADEFNKSLEASNARVIAFGASAGLIMVVDRALKAMVSSAIKVEKAMADVNVVMNASTKNLEKFGQGMFKVARETAQGFDVVAEAATELARQGLGMEKTLMRAKDALILTRLTGMNAADAVKSLTAAVNSFNKEGVTSAQIINRMAKVDAAFAVSSEDLAKSISRVGSSAVSAGVSMNELMAITTAVQQKTARGGAVIGNAFKTIFTRIQRSDVQSKLKGFGVATEDMSGKMLSGIQVMENLSKKFGTLTKSQQASVGESVAGVFQINILKAAMSDLSSQTSNYKRALDTANTATNEAYKRNEQLNQTLDALVNRTLANLTQAGASLGGGALGPAIENVLGVVNATLESFGKDGAMEGFGKTIGKGLMDGIGKFISGPGLVFAVAIFGKLALSLGKFATSALKDVLGINNATKQRAALEEAVVLTMAQEPAILAKIKAGTFDVYTYEQKILNTIRLQAAERRSLALTAGPIGGALYARGARVGHSGGAFIKGGPGSASGFVPNFANAGSERAAAAAGGYQAGAIRTMNQPGAGTMMYNSAETVKRFPGMSQSAIMPPQGSSAGAGYQSAFGAAHGFDPYAASGFVPNFAFKKGASSPWSTRNKKAGIGGREATYTLPANDIGVLLGYDERGAKSFNASAQASSLVGLRKSKIGKQLAKDNATIVLRGIRAKSFQSPSSDATAEQLFAGDIDANLSKGMNSLSATMMKKMGIEGMPGKMGRLEAGIEGGIFEEAMRMSMKAAQAIPGAAFDFEAGAKPSDAMAKIFGVPITRIDAKRRLKSAQGGEMPKKYFNDPGTSKVGERLLTQLYMGKMGQFTGKGKAMGFVPNFSPLTSAVNREMQAGIPASAIRVGNNGALKSAGNPGGVGVYNTRDEPGGLSQGISRSKSMGINPQTHGAAQGVVPNYAFRARPPTGRTAAGMKESRLATDTAKATASTASSTSRMADFMEKNSTMVGMTGFMAYAAATGAAAQSENPKVGAGVGILANVGMFAGMGASMGAPAGGIGAVPGAAIGAGIGLLASFNDIVTLMDDGAEKFEESLQKTVTVIQENLNGLISSLDTLADYDIMTPKKRIEELSNLEKQRTDILAFLDKEAVESPIFSKVAQTVRKTLPAAGVMLSKGAPSSEELGKVRKELSSFGARKESAAIFAKAARTDFASLAEGPGMLQSLFANILGEPQLLRNRVKSGVLGKSQSMMSGIISPTVSAEMLTGRAQTSFPGQQAFGNDLEMKDIGALARSNKLSDQKRAAEKFRDLASRTGFKGIAEGITNEVVNSDRLSEKGIGARFAFSSLFKKGGMFSPQMLDAASVAQKKGPQEDPLEAKRRLRLSQAGSFRGSQRAAAAGRDSAARLTTGMGDLTRRGASENLENRLAQAMIGATEFGKELIKSKALLEQDRILKEKDLAIDKVNLQQKEALVLLTAKAEKTFMDNLIKADDIGTDEREKVKYRLMALQNDPDAARKVRQELETSDNISAQDKLLLAYLKTSIDGEADARSKSGIKITEANAAQTANTENLNKSTKSLNDLYDAAQQFQYGKRAGVLINAAETAANVPAGLRAMQQGRAPGYAGQRFGVTEQEIASAKQDARMKAFRAGTGTLNPAASFGESFAYGENDALLEFDSGVKDVAKNMKTSFADAFQSMASGANSVEGALANMAQSILNSISSMSANMMTNMLFSKMGWQGSQGGLVPGYAGGGVVRGGSGYRDDVPTMMQGGEFVIKKSSAQKIGYGKLNAINGYAEGGPTQKQGPGMGTMAMVSMGASALSGVIGAATQPGSPKPLPSRDYGLGKGKYGHFGGADPDAGQVDTVTGGGGRAGVSLGKGFVYYRRDPETGRLISERARPTEGRFEVSRGLSLMGRLGEDDPQTGRMFGKEQSMAKYQDYLETETASRKAQIDAVKKQKKQRLIGAYMNAAMMIGGAKLFGPKAPGPDVAGPGGQTYSSFEGSGGQAYGLKDMGFGNKGYGTGTGSSLMSGTWNSNYNNSVISTPGSADMLRGMGAGIGADSGYNRPVSLDHVIHKGPPGGALGGYQHYANGGSASGTPAMVMGGEYIMSPETVRTHGANFMHELNRGNVPSYANGGPTGGASAGNQGPHSEALIGGNTTNNVKISVNIDKAGKADASADTGSGGGGEREDNEQANQSKEFSKLLQGVVLDEIVKQQRPGGLLQANS